MKLRDIGLLLAAPVIAAVTRPPHLVASPCC